jgi:site-specific DNA recombinase
MKTAIPKPLRCAIYTRKSTEHNLDLAFNSLDAQREACEAYIKSQAHEGWRLLPVRYDDGGLSGASLERPVLQLLLTEVKEGRVNVIVVYKVDRLTRSLADFAKLVETFDHHEVSFVSVTLVGDIQPALGKQILYVAIAQGEAKIEPHRMLDDNRRKAVASIRDCCHATILRPGPTRSSITVTLPAHEIVMQPTRAGVVKQCVRAVVSPSRDPRG